MAKAKAPTSADPVLNSQPSPTQADPSPQNHHHDKRIHRGTQQFDHDLFKLKVATMRKNVSWNESPMIESFEHCHLFHTIDSGGKRLSRSTSVGGHFHEIEVIGAEKGVPIIKVGPPRKDVIKKFQGKMKKATGPIILERTEDGDPICDMHTHEVQYLGSEVIQAREVNTEFQKFDIAIRAKQQPSVDGVK